MSETCPVCKNECETDATTCSICGFADKLGINNGGVTPEGAQHWLDTVVKPYRAKWEKDGLLARLEASEKREAELQMQIEAAKRTASSSMPAYSSPTQENAVSKVCSRLPIFLKELLWDDPEHKAWTFLIFTFVLCIIGGIIAMIIFNISGYVTNLKHFILFGFASCFGAIIGLAELFKFDDDDLTGMGICRLIFLGIFTGIGGGISGGISNAIGGNIGGKIGPFIIFFGMLGAPIIGGAIFSAIGWLIVRKRK